MMTSCKSPISGFVCFALAALFVSLGSRTLAAEPLVPGTGVKIENVGDDFEDVDWQYVFNGPKSSRDLDHRDNEPGGESANGRWYEGMKRGHPDVIRRIKTPPAGLPGSRGALLLRSLHTGVPGQPSFKMQQDDFIADVNYRLGGAIHVTDSPSVVTRVYLPPVEQWENRTGPHFAFRVALMTTIVKRPDGAFSLLSSPRPIEEVYWPGMFIEFQSKTDGFPHDYAYFRLRADSRGNDFKARQITTTGWWTLGLSVTPDGRVHYFAKPGVDDLTEADYIASQLPYGYQAEHLQTFFFNVCNGDDGRSWSTPWVIDDPTVYYVPKRR